MFKTKDGNEEKLKVRNGKGNEWQENRGKRRNERNGTRLNRKGTGFAKRDIGCVERKKQGIMGNTWRVKKRRGKERTMRRQGGTGP